MPFKSDAQRRFMYSQHPKIARRWSKEEKEQKLSALELAVTNLATLVFVSGAGDDATPVDLVVGNRIHGNKSAHKEISSLLGTTLKRMYSGRTEEQDPSEDPTSSVNSDTDTARETGVPGLSGQGPTMHPMLQRDTEAKKKFVPKGQ